MRGLQRIRDLNGEIQQLADRHRLATHSRAERLPLDQFHHDEMLLVVAIDFVNRADVGVVERRRGARLAPQPLHGHGIARQLRR
jgi:hypothetical protein